MAEKIIPFSRPFGQTEPFSDAQISRIIMIYLESFDKIDTMLQMLDFDEEDLVIKIYHLHSLLVDLTEESLQTFKNKLKQLQNPLTLVHGDSNKVKLSDAPLVIWQASRRICSPLTTLEYYHALRDVHWCTEPGGNKDIGPEDFENYKKILHSILYSEDGTPNFATHDGLTVWIDNSIPVKEDAGGESVHVQ